MARGEYTDPGRYVLHVRAGPTADTLEPVDVNNDAQPTRIATEHFDGHVMVRIHGWPDCHSAYFDNSRDLFCLQIVGRFLCADITANDIVFGNQFERPLKLPWGSSMALKFAQWWDVGLDADLSASRPFAFSPLIVTMNRLCVQEGPLPPWPFPAGQSVTEDLSLFSRPAGDPKDRQKFYNKPHNRQTVKVTDKQVWSMDFANPFLDMKKCVINIPGLSIDCFKYWDGQPLRFVAKTKDDLVTFFVIEFSLQPCQ